MFVLGVDPGLSRCGYAVLESGRRRPVVRAIGVLRTPTTEAVPERLRAIQLDVRELMAEFPPDTVVLERVLFTKNVRTAIGVAQAAGIVMAEAIGAGAEVVEYSPNEIKQTVAGDGSADKDQMEAMVQRLLRIDAPIRPVDAADAAAVALCHLARVPMRTRIAEAVAR